MEAVGSIIGKALEWRSAQMAIATVLSTWGSAPRPRGSHMLVHEDGRFEGSVSGGCVEGDVLATAAAVIASGEAVLKRYGVADANAWEVGLPCGGTIEVLVQPVADNGFPIGLIQALDAAIRRGEGLTVSTDPAKGISQAAEIKGQFIQHYRPARRLIIVGGVQIAQALVGIARAIGFATVVIDPRSRFLTPERFPDTVLDDRWPDEAVAALRPDASTAVVTLSHDPKIDDPALIAALAAPTGYVAALGSRKSHAARRTRLAAAGVAETDLDRIDGPAGIDIGAVGPAEIALSVAAGMVKALGEKASDKDMRNEEKHAPDTALHAA
jgi:xanthine dehydrogenase accessory factor